MQYDETKMLAEIVANGQMFETNPGKYYDRLCKIHGVTYATEIWMAACDIYDEAHKED